jgi:signal recognition particle receptor subunit beta
LTPGASKVATLQSALSKEVTSAIKAVDSARKKVASTEKALTATIKEAAKLKVGTVEHHQATLAVLAAEKLVAQAKVDITEARVSLAQALLEKTLNEPPHYDCKKVAVIEKNLAYEKMKLAEDERNLLEAELVVAMAKVPADAAYIELLHRDLTHASSVVDSAWKEYDGFADVFATVPASTLDSPGTF